MKKIIALLVLVAVVFLVFNRYRVYVRDPIATLTRGGVKEDGAQMFINYANDVLIENDNSPRYLELLQHDQHAGVPEKITCIHWVACLLDADVATMLPGSNVHPEVMNSKMVQFRDQKGEADVELR